MKKELFITLFLLPLLSFGPFAVMASVHKFAEVLADTVIYDQHKWKPNSGIIPPLFPNNATESVNELGNAKELKNSSINTTFSVAMVVEKDGHVSSYTPGKSAHPLVAIEVIRLLKPMPRAKPASKNGKPVRFRIYYEFSFKSNREPK